MGSPLRIDATNVFEDSKETLNLAVSKHASRQTYVIHVKHHLVRGTSGAGKVRIMYVEQKTILARTCSPSRCTWQSS